MQFRGGHAPTTAPTGDAAGEDEAPFAQPPSISLPKGGGAIRGIGEKFAANPVTGTGSMTVPIATSPGRSGFGPQLSLSYDSGAGNGPFGFGWSLSLPADHPQDRQGAAAVPGRRGVRRLHPLRRRRPGAGSRSRTAARFKDDTTAPRLRHPPLPPAHRGPVRPHRALDRGRDRRDPLALDHPRQRHHAVRQGQRLPHRRSADPLRPSDARLQLADLRELRRQGQRHRLRVRGRERRQRRSRPGQRAQPRAHGQPLPEAHQYGNRVESRPRSGSRDLAQLPDAWMFEVVFDYDEGHYEEVDLDPARPEAEQHRFVRASASAGSRLGRSAPTRSPPIAPGSRCAPTAAAGAC